MGVPQSCPRTVLFSYIVAPAVNYLYVEAGMYVFSYTPRFRTGPFVIVSYETHREGGEDGFLRTRGEPHHAVFGITNTNLHSIR